jgi:hypothetical protein
MTFSSILDVIDKYIRVKQWLQYVGLALCLISFFFLPATTHVSKVAKFVGVVGGFVSLTGFLYDLIYP